MFKKIIILFIFLFSTIAFSQTVVIKGHLVNESKEPVVGANVFIIGTVIGSASDDSGQFSILKVPEGEYTLSISVIGYQQKTIPLTTKAGEVIDLDVIILKSTPLQSQPIIVTASKYKQNMRDVPVSISSISSQEIEYRNSITIDKALQYVPGISMNQDQVNIRGSSGYSRGVGSRVMMLVDGVPYIAGDTQGLVFEAMAINQIENIEIVKGAGSALYGSSAIGGVINVITKSISDNPELTFKLYGGLYSDPYYEQWKWSDKTRYLFGAKADYSGKIGKSGIRLSVAQDEDDSYRRNDWKKRYNIGGKFEHEFSPFEKLTISGNYMDQKRGNFLYWKNLQNALEPPASQLNDKVHASRFYISPTYRKIISPTNFYKIYAIWFHNYWDDNIGDPGNHSTADNINIEFQYNISLSNHFLTFGLTPSINNVTSNIFGSRNGFGAAVYLQDEIRWNDQWLTTFGTRVDYYDIDKLGSDIGVNPKVGIVFKPDPTTALRMSFGTGFRAPSMAEAFTSTVAGGLTVIPNENLKSEKSVSAELGLNKLFSQSVIADLTVFYNRYWDLIEGGFTPDFNIRFENVTNARVIGFEVNLQWQLISRILFSSIGYTYIDPQNLTSKDFLRYRPRHILYTNARWNISRFSVGFDYRFLSRYDRIDEQFAQIVDDAEERVDTHTVDIRISQDFDIAKLPVSISFQVNNLLQYNYIDLIGSIAPIRNYIFTFETRF